MRASTAQAELRLPPIDESRPQQKLLQKSPLAQQFPFSSFFPKAYGPPPITRNYALADNGRGNTASSSASSSETSSSAPSLAAALFPSNPSIGLRLLGPLVPASDNKPALLLLTTAQLFFGLSLMTKRTPRIAESRLYARSAATVRYCSGAAAVLLSGLEYARLYLPYDPWAEEAKVWRRWAIKNGYQPSWWAGAVGHYEPMPLGEWKSKVSSWIVNTANALEAEDVPENGEKDVLSHITIGPHSALKPGDSNTYNDIYSNLRRINAKRRTELLAEMASVTELTKGERIDELLEGKGRVRLNEDYTKPSIQLGNHTMESTEEFDMVWINFDPWDELAQDTDYDIRWIPRWRCLDEDPEEA